MADTIADLVVNLRADVSDAEDKLGSFEEQVAALEATKVSQPQEAAEAVFGSVPLQPRTLPAIP